MKAIRIFVFVTFISLAAIAVPAQGNSIYGQVVDAQSRQPVGEIFIELLTYVGAPLRRLRLDRDGRFAFFNLRGGDYQIKVLTSGTNYQEQIKDVRIVSLPLGNGRMSSDSVYVDIYLKMDPKKTGTGDGAATVIFAQDVPKDARKLYKKGVQQLDDKKDEGLELLKQAIEIFPTYYDALDRLGSEYVQRKQYEEGAPLLARAADINKRSYNSFYWLGIANYNLKNLPAAIEALRGAVAIKPASLNAQLFYGMLLRTDGNYELAEKALLQAKSLSEKSAPVAEVHWQLALLYEKTARYKEAADELERFLKIQPDTADAEKIRKFIDDLRAKAEAKAK